jgi:hypothetical protein
MRSARLLAGFIFFLLAIDARGKTWIVPGVMNGSGANGVAFSTDLTLVNPDGVARFVTIIPIGPPGSPIFDPIGITLQPGETLFTGSFLAGAGALRISGDGGTAVFARINSTRIGPAGGVQMLPSPVHGSRLPVIDADTLLKSGETGHSGWVSHSKDPNSGDRTNVAIVFPDGGAATVTLFDARGMLLGSASYDVPGPSFLQSSLDVLTGVDVPVGRIAVNVTRGTACGYTGVVDNVTGDLAIVPTDRLPPPPPAFAYGRVDLLSSGVAQTAGRDGASWHTDARVSNPGTTAIGVTAYLLGTGGATPQQGLLAVDAGQTVEIIDVVQSLFNVSEPVTGVILWRASGALLVNTRTREGVSTPISASCVFGAILIDGFITELDPTGVLGDLRQDDQFRTNLLAAAGPGGATFFLDLFDETGQLLGTARESLPALSWGEFPLSELFAGVTLPARAGLLVRVEVGSVNVQAMVVDNFSKVPILYEASPRGVRVMPPTPLLPPGSWGGAPNGMDHLTVDAASISIYRMCESGAFAQPLWLGAEGSFAVMGIYFVSAGPAFQFDAILSGHTDGHSATIQVMQVGTAFSLGDTSLETFVLGGPFTPFTGACPIEY